jgi:trans-aconitate methyltransferase
MPINIAINSVVNNKKWLKYTENKNIGCLKNHHELDYYYEILNNYSNEIILCETHYFHILPTLKGIIDFVRTTALKPYLEIYPMKKKDRN